MIVVTANTGSVCVPIDVGDGQAVLLGAGQRLLRVGARGQVADGQAAVVLPDTGLVRVLAHWDHAHGVVQRAASLAAPVAHARVDLALEVPAVAQAWLIGGLLASREGDGAVDPALALVLHHLVRDERYGLVRFLLEQGPQHSIAALAGRYGLSLAQFHRRCRQVFGHSLKRELRTMRAARALLAYPDRPQSFTHLAADHGYASLSHFCTDIKALIGHSPLSVYRAVTPTVE
ncbi:helix-turn-helix domain-containing protein [Stenotrophomonas sp.]|uniref:helix-turn-helix domain-containing protein n=1 Tax=Stenotrophomonas sp. TaxID=69392 RepID=UPI002FCC074F